MERDSVAHYRLDKIVLVDYLRELFPTIAADGFEIEVTGIMYQHT